MADRSWHDHRAQIVALVLAILLMALPGQLTRPLQSGWQLLLAPGRCITHAGLASGAAVLAHGWSCIESAESIAAQQQTLRNLEAQLQRANAERDIARIELARLRYEQAVDHEALGESAPLLTAELVSAHVLSPQSQTLLGRRQLIEQGTNRGVENDALVIESPTPLLDLGGDDGTTAGQLVLSGRRIWGKIASAGRWTSSVCYIGDAGYRDVILIVAADARNTRSGAIRGVLYGTDEPLCRVRYVSARQPVSVGDWVISALGDDLGYGPLCYGKVVRIEESVARSDWEIWVEPSIPRNTVLHRVAVVCPGFNPARLGSKPSTAEVIR